MAKRLSNTAGPIMHMVEFQERVTAPDGYGNQQIDFAQAFPPMRAAITMLKAGEQIMADRLEGRQTAVVRVRACDDTARIRADWRIRDTRDGTLYAISGPPTPSADRGFFDILVQTKVAA